MGIRNPELASPAHRGGGGAHSLATFFKEPPGKRYPAAISEGDWAGEPLGTNLRCGQRAAPRVWGRRSRSTSLHHRGSFVGPHAGPGRRDSPRYAFQSVHPAGTDSPAVALRV